MPSGAFMPSTQTTRRGSFGFPERKTSPTSLYSRRKENYCTDFTFKSTNICGDFLPKSGYGKTWDKSSDGYGNTSTKLGFGYGNSLHKSDYGYDKTLPKSGYGFGSVSPKSKLGYSTTIKNTSPTNPTGICTRSGRDIYKEPYQNSTSFKNDDGREKFKFEKSQPEASFNCRDSTENHNSCYSLPFNVRYPSTYCDTVPKKSYTNFPRKSAFDASCRDPPSFYPSSRPAYKPCTPCKPFIDIDGLCDKYLGYAAPTTKRYSRYTTRDPAYTPITYTGYSDGPRSDRGCSPTESLTCRRTGFGTSPCLARSCRASPCTSPCARLSDPCGSPIAKLVDPCGSPFARFSDPCGSACFSYRPISFNCPEPKEDQKEKRGSKGSKGSKGAKESKEPKEEKSGKKGKKDKKGKKGEKGAKGGKGKKEAKAKNDEKGKKGGAKKKKSKSPKVDNLIMSDESSEGSKKGKRSDENLVGSKKRSKSEPRGSGGKGDAGTRGIDDICRGYLTNYSNPCSYKSYSYYDPCARVRSSCLYRPYNPDVSRPGDCPTAKFETVQSPGKEKKKSKEEHSEDEKKEKKKEKRAKKGGKKDKNKGEKETKGGGKEKGKAGKEKKMKSPPKSKNKGGHASSCSTHASDSSSRGSVAFSYESASSPEKETFHLGLKSDKSKVIPVKHKEPAQPTNNVSFKVHKTKDNKTTTRQHSPTKQTQDTQERPLNKRIASSPSRKLAKQSSISKRSVVSKESARKGGNRPAGLGEQSVRSRHQTPSNTRSRSGQRVPTKSAKQQESDLNIVLSVPADITQTETKDLMSSLKAILDKRSVLEQRKRSVSVERTRSVSMERKRSVSPERNRPVSVERKRSVSHERSRSLSPGRNKSFSPQKKKSPSKPATSKHTTFKQATSKRGTNQGWHCNTGSNSKEMTRSWVSSLPQGQMKSPNSYPTSTAQEQEDDSLEENERNKSMTISKVIDKSKHKIRTHNQDPNGRGGKHTKRNNDRKMNQNGCNIYDTLSSSDQNGTYNVYPSLDKTETVSNTEEDDESSSRQNLNSEFADNFENISNNGNKGNQIRETAVFRPPSRYQSYKKLSEHEKLLNNPNNLKQIAKCNKSLGASSLPTRINKSLKADAYSTERAIRAKQNVSIVKSPVLSIQSDQQVTSSSPDLESLLNKVKGQSSSPARLKQRESISMSTTDTSEVLYNVKMCNQTVDRRPSRPGDGSFGLKSVCSESNSNDNNVDKEVREKQNNFLRDSSRFTRQDPRSEFPNKKGSKITGCRKFVPKRVNSFYQDNIDAQKKAFRELYIQDSKTTDFEDRSFDKSPTLSVKSDSVLAFSELDLESLLNGVKGQSSSPVRFRGSDVFMSGLLGENRTFNPNRVPTPQITPSGQKDNLNNGIGSLPTPVMSPLNKACRLSPAKLYISHPEILTQKRCLTPESSYTEFNTESEKGCFKENREVHTFFQDSKPAVSVKPGEYRKFTDTGTITTQRLTNTSTSPISEMLRNLPEAPLEDVVENRPKSASSEGTWSETVEKVGLYHQEDKKYHSVAQNISHRKDIHCMSNQRGHPIKKVAKYTGENSTSCGKFCEYQVRRTKKKDHNVKDVNNYNKQEEVNHNGFHKQKHDNYLQYFKKTSSAHAQRITQNSGIKISPADVNDVYSFSMASNSDVISSIPANNERFTCEEPNNGGSDDHEYDNIFAFKDQDTTWLDSPFVMCKTNDSKALDCETKDSKTKGRENRKMLEQKKEYPKKGNLELRACPHQNCQSTSSATDRATKSTNGKANIDRTQYQSSHGQIQNKFIHEYGVKDLLKDYNAVYSDRTVNMQKNTDRKITGLDDVTSSTQAICQGDLDSGSRSDCSKTLTSISSDEITSEWNYSENDIYYSQSVVRQGNNNNNNNNIYHSLPQSDVCDESDENDDFYSENSSYSIQTKVRTSGLGITHLGEKNLSSIFSNECFGLGLRIILELRLALVFVWLGIGLVLGLGIGLVLGLRLGLLFWLEFLL